jgi:hypothetical protein
MIRILTLAGLAIVANTQPASASPVTDARMTTTDARMARQEARIDAGIENGRINTGEAARLDAQQDRIKARSDRLAADGRYSRRDYASVTAQQHRSRQSIALARRNGR